MKNLDTLNQQKMEIQQKMQDAFKNGDEAAFGAAFNEFAQNIADQVMAKTEIQQQSADTAILAARGVRQLTSEERDYFQQVGEAMRSSNPKQALSNLDVVMPKTTINAVFEDLTAEHPLLDYIDFQNTSGLIEIIYNTHSDQLGTWGQLTGEIAKKLTSGFQKVNATLAKYSAFIPVAKSMLDLGPEWLEAYVRTILQEAIYLGLEEAIVNGTGKDMPIGMNRKVGEGVTVTDGVYPVKDTVEVAAIDPITYGSLLATLATGPHGKPRIVSRALMVVNPVDYFQKIMPATTIRGADGKYVNDVFPFPTTVVQSIHVPTGKMIVGLPKRYFMGVGTAKSGKIEHDDSYRFLEDERVYLCKLYGYGAPKDNNAFIYCDISALEPAIREVKVISTSAGGSAVTPDFVGERSAIAGVSAEATGVEDPAAGTAEDPDAETTGTKKAKS